MLSVILVASCNVDVEVTKTYNRQANQTYNRQANMTSIRIYIFSKKLGFRGSIKSSGIWVIEKG